MKITFVNVGYGECILLQAPDKRYEDGVFTMLLDGGSGEPSEFEDRSSGRNPAWEYLRRVHVRHLDVMACTHIHEDHLCGLLPVWESLKARELWRVLPEQLSGTLPLIDPSLSGNDSQRKFIHALNDYQVLCRKARSGSAGTEGKACSRSAGPILTDPYKEGSFEPAEGLKIQVIGPDEKVRKALAEDIRSLYIGLDTGEAGPQGVFAVPGDKEEFLKKLDRADAAMNNRSMVLRVTYKGTRILLPGDTNKDGWKGIPDEYLAADLYKVGHHGQKDGCSEYVLCRIKPSYVVCCASSDRRYQSAAPELISMIGKSGAKMYYSDCPVIPGITDEEKSALRPHHAVSFAIGEKGRIEPEYEV